MCKSLIAVAVASVLGVPAVQAATATGTLTVKATVTASCTINTSATGTTTDAVLDFGTVSSFAANTDANTSTAGGSQVGVLCNNGTSWALALDGGQNSRGSSQRQMSGGTSELIPYDLYTDSGYTNAIGISTTALSGTGTGSEQKYDIYGRIPAGSTLPSVGSYIDTVTMTITY
ncbi:MULTISPECIES: spore coat U domain-containing protein [Klebsiella]|uniref:Csu type fimbrial protein n=1 Tax=Klebsiella TaxID=570 RepID=UPI00202F1676|nr:MULTISPECIES: spore coat U domain-containing protein [Klebsiella]MCM0764459.1 spore coat U domain-containing protein [Klebsiella pneumoniae]MCM0770010.1 spore coat U domain-containing protein [Klebsiella pneumoniae]MCM0777123.1 spore coat U domain-containing protein [Klebsiella pneumoniae]MCM0801087.1 spore coat U domain-containing protein [Klebsiella pneumoniae]MCM0899928.1 spore coat U domain-containing protein [Klebsiella pneumoniae]